ncbi:MAG: urease accessory protein UreF [Cyanobacteria bacterium P01_G01_bin.54]
MTDPTLLRLLQLVSPALPIGAYSYSEGLETLVESGVITTAEQLTTWLQQSLRYGPIRTEAAVMLRAYAAVAAQNSSDLERWNQWLSATRETAELRQSSWQMGRSLLQLFRQIEPELATALPTLEPGNYAIAFGAVAACWQISPTTALLGYLQGWLTHAITAAVKLIPLGQTSGQQILLALSLDLLVAREAIACLSDAELVSCSWGPSLASMNHETQYTRLFRS